MRGPCRLGLKLWKLEGGLFCSAGGCRASRAPKTWVQGWCGFAATGVQRGHSSPDSTAIEMQAEIDNSNDLDDFKTR